MYSNNERMAFEKAEYKVHINNFFFFLQHRRTERLITNLVAEGD